MNVAADKGAADGNSRLRLNYLSWGTEEPYYTSEVLPFLRRLPRQ